MVNRDTTFCHVILLCMHTATLPINHPVPILRLHHLLHLRLPGLTVTTILARCILEKYSWLTFFRDDPSSYEVTHIVYYHSIAA